MSELIGERQLALEWGCHRSTVSRLLCEAGIQPIYLSKKTGGTKRYRRSEVDQYLAQCTASDAVGGE